MERLKRLNRDSLYKIDLKLINNCYEYVLVSANDSDEIYIILNDGELEE